MAVKEVKQVFQGHGLKSVDGGTEITKTGVELAALESNLEL